jgi:hypothetical protein
MYFVIQKHSGSFDGPYAAYFGGFWIRINYPNAFDAQRGRMQNLISAQQQREIATKWSNRHPTLERTALGGGIGFMVGTKNGTTAALVTSRGGASCCTSLTFRNSTRVFQKGRWSYFCEGGLGLTDQGIIQTAFSPAVGTSNSSESVLNGNHILAPTGEKSRRLVIK